MSAKPINEEAAPEPVKKRTGECLARFLRLDKPSGDGLHFILLEGARVPVAVPRGRKLAPVDPRKRAAAGSS